MEHPKIQAVTLLLLAAGMSLGFATLTGCQQVQREAATLTPLPKEPAKPSPSPREITNPEAQEVHTTSAPVLACPIHSDLPQGEDGSVEYSEVIIETENTIYCELTYWSDGLRVKGLLGYPKGAGPYPAIIFNRGGNRDAGALGGWELIPFVETGYAAVGSQYRGNLGGEGQEEFGGADVNDVLNLILLLKSLPIVDPERIGMVGMSRGGMETYIALRRDHEDGIQDLKVAAVVSGVADMFMWSEERLDVLEGVMIPLIGATPQERPDLYEARSATYWPELIDAPLLIQHGEDDDRVSVEQARKLAQGLLEAGKTVELIIYPGEDHALSNHNKGFPEMLSWFQKYLERPGEDLSLASHHESIRVVAEWFAANHPPP
jgi:dienelactone hydrolase